MERASELDPSQPNVLRQEPGPDEHRPEETLVIVHLMVVHLDKRLAITHTESEELEKRLAEPGRHDNLEQAAGSKNAMTFVQDRLGLPEVLETVDQGDI